MSGAYATYFDLIAYTDARTVQELLSDSDSGEYTGDPASDTKLAALLQTASGEVEAACGVSDLYNPCHLAALTGNSQAMLKQLVCTLCLCKLVRRRPEKWASEYWQNAEERTEKYLDRLRKGERLFDDPCLRKAGLPSVEGPSGVEMRYLNMLPQRTQNYFPDTPRLPLGRGG